MYQRQGNIAFKKDLTNTLALTRYLNNPEKKFRSIHIAGTNGKGSTCHMIASILQEAGYRVGLYTSPHLKDFRERIKINGKEVSEDFVVDFVEKNKVFLESQGLSFFEMTVGMAFYYFAVADVDIAIIEVGLGGRLDSTNIITPLISVITNIDYDHMQMLGDTLPEIAFEKAGIIKPGIPVIIGEKQEAVFSVFTAKANEKSSLLIVAPQDNKQLYQTDLKGSYQLKNLNTAVTTLKTLREKDFDISDGNIKNGLLNVAKNTGFKGRWQVLKSKPKVICDTAHNVAGLGYVMRQLKEQKYNKLHMVIGVVNDKNLDNILPLFPKDAIYYFCKPDIPRGLDAEFLKENAKVFLLEGTVFNSVAEAYKKAVEQAVKNDLIFIGGSTFVVAEVV